MKVIAMKGESYNRSYLCEVSDTELRKFLNQYHDRPGAPLQVDEHVDLGKGHDFYHATLRQIETLKRHVEALSGAADNLLSRVGVKMLMQAEREQQEADLKPGGSS